MMYFKYYQLVFQNCNATIANYNKPIASFNSRLHQNYIKSLSSPCASWILVISARLVSQPTRLQDQQNQSAKTVKKDQ